MSHLFSALSQAILLAGMLMIPGLGTVDLCLAQEQICHEAKAGSCCCPLEETGDDENPCCITVHQDWMVPLKEDVTHLSSAHLVALAPACLVEISLPAPLVDRMPVSAEIDPPPLPRAVYLALIQVRLV